MPCFSFDKNNDADLYQDKHTPHYHTPDFILTLSFSFRRASALRSYLL